MSVAAVPDPAAGAGRTARIRLAFRVLWSLWGALALALAAPLALATGGHPPGWIFVPAVAVAWLLGHLAIWGLKALVVRAARGAGDPASRASRARALITAWAGLGVLAGGALLLFALASLYYQNDWRNAFKLLVVGVLAGAWGLHLATLAGLLSDRRWGRGLAALLAAAWAAAGLYLIVGGIVDRLPGFTFLGVGATLLFGWLAWALGRETLLRAHTGG